MSGRPLYLEYILKRVNEGLAKVPLNFDPTRAKDHVVPPPPARPRLMRREPFNEFQMVVQSLTNWQRSKWAQAGYPNSMKKLEKFAAMKHWKHKG